MTDLLDRVVQLIALASSPEREEARTAAHLACDLIREHKLVICQIGTDGGLRARSPAPQTCEPTSTRRKHRTVVVQRCAGCGDVVPPPGGLCAPCREERAPRGAWTVDCERCGRSTPPMGNVARANEVAWEMGFRLVGEMTVCPFCVVAAPKTARGR